MSLHTKLRDHALCDTTTRNPTRNLNFACVNQQGLYSLFEERWRKFLNDSEPKQLRSFPRLAHHIGGDTPCPAPHVQGHHEHLRRCLLVLNIAGTVVHHPSRTSDRWHHQNLHAFVSKPNVNANQSGTFTTRSTSDQTRQPPRQLATLPRLETDLGKTAGTCDELISAILMACPCAEYLCTGPWSSRFSSPSPRGPHARRTLLPQTAIGQQATQGSYSQHLHPVVWAHTPQASQSISATTQCKRCDPSAQSSHPPQTNSRHPAHPPPARAPHDRETRSDWNRPAVLERKKKTIANRPSPRRYHARSETMARHSSVIFSATRRNTLETAAPDQPSASQNHLAVPMRRSHRGKPTTRRISEASEDTNHRYFKRLYPQHPQTPCACKYLSQRRVKTEGVARFVWTQRNPLRTSTQRAQQPRRITPFSKLLTPPTSKCRESNETPTRLKTPWGSDAHNDLSQSGCDPSLQPFMPSCSKLSFVIFKWSGLDHLDRLPPFLHNSLVPHLLLFSLTSVLCPPHACWPSSSENESLTQELELLAGSDSDKSPDRCFWARRQNHHKTSRSPNETSPPPFLF